MPQLRNLKNILITIGVVLLILVVFAITAGVIYRLNVRKDQTVTTLTDFQLADFKNLKLGTPYSDIKQQFGPTIDIGSGLHIFVYTLDDKSQVLLGFADLNNLMYVKHKLNDGTIEDINSNEVSEQIRLHTNGF